MSKPNTTKKLVFSAAAIALATVISQFLSALWAVAFLCGKKALLRLRPSSMRVRWKLVGEICALGLSGFIMSATNSVRAYKSKAAKQNSLDSSFVDRLEEVEE